MHSPVSIRHAQLTNFISTLMALFTERHDLGKLYREVVAVRFDRRNVFLPDLAFYSTARLNLIGETFIDGAPDLVVEVLSKTTASRDVTQKFVAYERHGVKEYWILDPLTLTHSFFRHNGEVFVEIARDEPSFASEVLPGFNLQRRWLVPEALPKVEGCLEGLSR